MIRLCRRTIDSRLPPTPPGTVRRTWVPLCQGYRHCRTRIRSAGRPRRTACRAALRTAASRPRSGGWPGLVGLDLKPDVLTYGTLVHELVLPARDLPCFPFEPLSRAGSAIGQGAALPWFGVEEAECSVAVGRYSAAGVAVAAGPSGASQVAQRCLAPFAGSDLHGRSLSVSLRDFETEHAA